MYAMADTTSPLCLRFMHIKYINMRDSLFYQAVSRHLNLVHTFDVFPNLHGLPTPANTYVNLQNVLNKCLKNVLSNYLKKDLPCLKFVT